MRAAGLGDLDDLVRLHIAGYEDTYRGRMPDEVIDVRTPELRRRAWVERLSSPGDDDFVLVADVDHEVGGFASGRTASPDEDDSAGSVGCWENLYLDPSHIGTSTGLRLGLALHEAVLAEFAERGFREAVGFVLPANQRAVRFFEMVGWRRDGGERVSEGVQLLRYRRLMR